MQLIIWHPRTYSVLLPALVVWVAMLLETIPFPLSFLIYVKPYLFFIAIWYFHFHYPRYMPLWGIFFLTIFYDVEMGQRVGITALCLWLTLIFPRFFRKNFHEEYGMNFLGKFGVCLLIYIAAQQLLMVAFGAYWQSWLLLGARFAISLILTPFFWRLLSFFDRYMIKLS